MVGYEPTKSPKEIQVPGLNLSRAEAKERADHLYVNSYVVTLDVTKGEETFYSKSEVSFTCNKPGYLQPDPKLSWIDILRRVPSKNVCAECKVIKTPRT